MRGGWGACTTRVRQSYEEIIISDILRRVEYATFVRTAVVYNVCKAAPKCLSF